MGKHMRMVVLLLSSVMPIVVGCREAQTPPPAPLGTTVSIKVFVVRDFGDTVGNPPPNQRIGYAYSDNHIRDVVNQARMSLLMAGTQVNIPWNNQVYEIALDLQVPDHLWAGYIQWVPLLSNRPDYQNNAVNIYFVPGIIDSSNPTRFMDSYTLDPAKNGDPFWTDGDPAARPSVFISDCWVSPICTGPINGMPASRLIPQSSQLQHYLLERALGRYFLRFDDNNNSNPLWDNQEYWTGASGNYMSWWNNRVNLGTAQGDVLQRIMSGNWNNP